MSDNVLVLGAGSSADAGIPLLNGFVDRMWDYATRGKIQGEAIPPAQLANLRAALEVRDELDGYHGRATFDDRNIEDILSILAFNVLGGGAEEENKLRAMTRAIASTIELSCRVKHPGIPKEGRDYVAVTSEPDSYRKFWKGLFDWAVKGNALPTIITLNYDLTLERALFQLLINTVYDAYKHRPPFGGIEINYFNDSIPRQSYRVEFATYDLLKRVSGTIIKPSIPDVQTKYFPVDLLKLHGSLNFPREGNKVTYNTYNLVASLDDPHILPPIWNKLSGNTAEKIWRTALNQLRQAKNIVFVGYSLPQTDLYMQFFLKAALGPNKNLNRIYVFDPVLCGELTGAPEMQSRYEACFSGQFRPRICFRPDNEFGHVRGLGIEAGTFQHFVQLLGLKPELMLF